MKTLHAGLCGALALALTFGACRDSSTGVMGGPRARSPSFATASDTGGGGGPGNQSHFMSNGDVGSVDWAGDSTATASDTGGGGGGGFTFGSLTVTRGGPPTTRRPSSPTSSNGAINSSTASSSKGAG